MKNFLMSNPVNRFRRARSQRDGNSAESRFLRIFPDSIPSSREDNIYKHIDFYVPDRFSVDVKGNNYPNEIWVEIKNVQGKKGWAWGEADYIAFEMYEIGGFIMVDTAELRDFVKENVEKTYTSKKDAYLKLYRRDGRMDTITKVVLSDLLGLPSTWIAEYNRDFIHPETKEVVSF